ncbi:AbrB/MazE/SpoVT family DNA-binding domain-containing protein [Paraclostridium bifermentans]|nr:AbrB/MazE/SpoVT family DNA-binding domain-containing protein [Paraclostridium bifermentans]
MKKNSKDLTVGVNRNIDDLGRVVLPKEMRDKLNLKKNSPVSIKTI